MLKCNFDIAIFNISFMREIPKNVYEELMGGVK